MEGDTKVATQGTYDRGSNNKRRNEGGNASGNSNGGNRNYRKPSQAGERNERSDRNAQRKAPVNKNYIPKYSNKDEDEEDLGRRSKPQRPRENKSQASASVGEKNKAMIRLEKEQKNMKKKQQNKKKESTRQKPKIKRANNVNYTRSYANGDFDDYEDYYD